MLQCDVLVSPILVPPISAAFLYPIYRMSVPWHSTPRAMSTHAVCRARRERAALEFHAGTIRARANAAQWFPVVARCEPTNHAFASRSASLPRYEVESRHAVLSALKGRRLATTGGKGPPIRTPPCHRKTAYFGVRNRRGAGAIALRPRAARARDLAGEANTKGLHCARSYQVCCCVASACNALPCQCVVRAARLSPAYTLAAATPRPQCLFPAMIQGWRAAFQQPAAYFGFVQLSTWCPVGEQGFKLGCRMFVSLQTKHPKSGTAAGV